MPLLLLPLLPLRLQRQRLQGLLAVHGSRELMGWVGREAWERQGVLRGECMWCDVLCACEGVCVCLHSRVRVMMCVFPLWCCGEGGGLRTRAD